MKQFRFDLKRIFAGRGVVALCLVTPMIVLLLFATVLLPMLATGEGVHSRVAVCCEDEDERVVLFMRLFFAAKGTRSILEYYPVDTPEEGRKLLDDGDVAIFAHIPKNMLADVLNGNYTEISLVAAPGHNLELHMAEIMLKSNLALAYSVMFMPNVVYDALMEQYSDADSGEVASYLDGTTESNLFKYMTRRAVFGKSSKLSLLGEMLPIPFYGSAIFSLFAALAVLPLVRFTSKDLSGSVLRRGLLCGFGRLRFYLARVAAGAVFVSLVLAMLIPTQLLLLLAGNIQEFFESDFLALVLSVVLISVCYSAMAFALGAWIRNSERSLWLSFYLVLIMGLLSGVLVSEKLLPGWAAAVGRILPMRAAMRLLGSAVLNANWGFMAEDMLKLLLAALLFISVGIAGIYRKAAAR